MVIFGCDIDAFKGSQDSRARSQDKIMREKIKSNRKVFKKHTFYLILKNVNNILKIRFQLLHLH
jgi:hypothetical protein